MSNHIEWVEATYPPTAYLPAELTDLADDGNPDGDMGLRLGESDGAMLYGTVHEIVVWLEWAVREVERIRKLEVAEKNRIVRHLIADGLSRDDEGEFDRKVSLVHNLLMPEERNPEYQYGIAKFIFEDTTWLDRTVGVEDVYWHIWQEETP